MLKISFCESFSPVHIFSKVKHPCLLINSLSHLATNFKLTILLIHNFITNSFDCFFDQVIFNRLCIRNNYKSLFQLHFCRKLWYGINCLHYTITAMFTMHSFHFERFLLNHPFQFFLLWLIRTAPTTPTMAFKMPDGGYDCQSNSND